MPAGRGLQPIPGRSTVVDVRGGTRGLSTQLSTPGSCRPPITHKLDPRHRAHPPSGVSICAMERPPDPGCLTKVESTESQVRVGLISVSAQRSAGPNQLLSASRLDGQQKESGRLVSAAAGDDPKLKRSRFVPGHDMRACPTPQWRREHPELF
jgi:hypothetical protein